MASGDRPAWLRLAARGWIAFVIAIGGLTSGCGAPSPREKVGYEFTPPVGWRQTEADRYMVPGKPLEAWEGPQGASLAVFESLRVPNPTTESVLEETVNRWINLPEWTIVERKMAQVGGAQVAWIEVVAPGSGDALAPTGQGKAIDPNGRPLKPTHRLAILIPLPTRTLQLVFHAPEEASQSLKPQWDEILASLKIQPQKAAKSSSY